LISFSELNTHDCTAKQQLAVNCFFPTLLVCSMSPRRSAFEISANASHGGDFQAKRHSGQRCWGLNSVYTKRRHGLEMGERKTAMLKLARDIWGALMLAGALSAATAARWIAEDQMDVAAFARRYLASRDLPARFRLGAALNQPERGTFYEAAQRLHRLSCARGVVSSLDS
jgi:hypothetical protein